MTNTNPNATDPPVTVEVIKHVKPGYEVEYEQALADILTAAQGFEGYLGANIFRSDDSSQIDRRIVFKFDRCSNLQKWEDAPIRQKLIDRANRFTLGEGSFKVLTGLETWFTLPVQKAIVPPPRYKMALISWLVIFPLSNLLAPILQNLLLPLPGLLISAVSSIVMVSLMTYIIMPRVTKLFAAWLYPPPKEMRS
jgi:uncharacterized protein